jgi:hypothetical protein
MALYVDPRSMRRSSAWMKRRLFSTARLKVRVVRYSFLLDSFSNYMPVYPAHEQLTNPHPRVFGWRNPGPSGDARAGISPGRI